MKKVLLCPPTYYDIDYEINPWMDVENKVNQQKVQEEYLALKQAYQDLGCTISEIQQKKNLPDMVYSANYGYVHKNTFIKANYKYDERKKEAEHAKEHFQNLGYTIKELPENIAWEGQGDLLKVGTKYFLGWAHDKRTDQEAKKYLSELLNSDIIDFHLIDPYYYHLDTCFLPLNTTTVAINPFAFEKKDLKKIEKNFQHIIYVCQEDNALLGCNAVVIGDTVVIGKGISQQLKNDFKSLGYKTKEVETSEYRKGGGSVKCLTLEFYG